MDDANIQFGNADCDVKSLSLCMDGTTFMLWEEKIDEEEKQSLYFYKLKQLSWMG